MNHTTYRAIQPGGGDTAKPLSLQKRLAVIQRFIQLRGCKVLDCGCGAGDYVLALHDMGADVWGIEYSAQKVAEFKRRHRLLDRVAVGDAQQTVFPDHAFDLILLNEVLEHVPNDLATLKEMHRLLKPAGKMILFSPNRLYPFETHGVFLKRSGRLVPHFTPMVPYIPLLVGQRFFRYWARNYWPLELRRLVRKAGFVIRHTDYLWQTFENISGHQPRLISAIKPWLQAIFARLERVPWVRALGVSQVIMAEKPALRSMPSDNRRG